MLQFLAAFFELRQPNAGVLDQFSRSVASGLGLSDIVLDTSHVVLAGKHSCLGIFVTADTQPVLAEPNTVGGNDRFSTL